MCCDMSQSPGVAFDTDMELRCSCGWTGTVTEIEELAVDERLDHVARVCPGCGTAVPEWGAFPDADGVERVARGNYRESLRS